MRVNGTLRLKCRDGGVSKSKFCIFSSEIEPECSTSVLTQEIRKMKDKRMLLENVMITTMKIKSKINILKTLKKKNISTNI